MIEHRNGKLSVRRQSELLGVTRSRLYYKEVPVDQRDALIMNEMRTIFREHPYYGYRRQKVALQELGYTVNRKAVHRFMQVAGIKALYPKRNLSIKNQAHKIYPYLLAGVKIDRPNQAWEVDITYIKIGNGFAYLVCIIDVFSRKIMGWYMSPFINTELCLQAFYNALKSAKPEILNSDQGCQFTSELWTATLKDNGIQISMDGKGRCLDNIFIERFWRSYKYESVFLRSFDSVLEARADAERYIKFYNNLRPHQALDYKTPNEVYNKNLNRKQEETKCFDLAEISVPTELIEWAVKNSQIQAHFWS
jgi:putative transposase